jgi:hypothetical protein
MKNLSKDAPVKGQAGDLKKGLNLENENRGENR